MKDHLADLKCHLFFLELACFREEETVGEKVEKLRYEIAGYSAVVAVIYSVYVCVHVALCLKVYLIIQKLVRNDLLN